MDLEKEINAIKERNKRVESDKYWERSFFRRGFITLVTYLVAFIFLLIIEVPRPGLAVLVPAGGYVFSTLSLSFLRGVWNERNKNGS